MEKRGIWIFIVIISLIGLSLILAVYIGPVPDNGHDGDKILMEINNYFMTLSEAVVEGYLNDGGNIPSDDLTTQISESSHNLDEIYVSVDGVESNLKEAIDGTGLCGTFDSSYSSNIILGHPAEKILITNGSVEKSLQEAINNGDFCCISQKIEFSDISYTASAKRWYGVGGELDTLIDGEVNTGISYSIQGNWNDANALVTVTFNLSSPREITELNVFGDCTYLAVISSGTETSVGCNNPIGNWADINSIKWSGMNLYTLITNGCGRTGCKTFPNGRTSYMYELNVTTSSC